MISTIAKYRDLFNKVLNKVTITSGDGSVLGGFEESVEVIAREALSCDARGGVIVLIGNGGSASICNHCATDWWKNGKVRTRVFYGDSQLTCLANDYGYEYIFSKPIEELTKGDDLLIAISSSGRSLNILNGVKAAREVGMKVITLSGFADDNPLKSMGDVNVYVPSDKYGFVELAHQIILHAASDAFEQIRTSSIAD